MVQRVVVSLLCVSGLGLLSVAATAGGMLVQELANPRNGVAQAGQAAYAYDAATSFYNPAGMSRLDEPRLLIGAQPLFTDIEFDAGSGTTFDGGSGGQQGGFVPGLGTYYVRPINDRWAIGASLGALAGGALDPDNDWAGRSYISDMSFVALGLNPVVSYRVNDWLSVGAGFMVSYASLDLDLRLPRAGNLIDRSAVQDKVAGITDAIRTAVRSELEQAARDLGQKLPPNLPEFIDRLPPPAREALRDRVAKELRKNLKNASAEVRAQLGPQIEKISSAAALFEPGLEGELQIEEADDFAFSFNLGVLIEPNDKTRFGISYRSEIEYDLEGKVDIENTPPLFEAIGFTKRSVELELPIPQLVRASVYHQLTPTLAIMGDVGWEDWSVMDYLPITGAAGAAISIPISWHDTWHFGVGLEWRAHPRWLLQTGVAYDTSPVRDSHHNRPDFPADRQWRVSCGLVYDWSESIQLGLNYTYVNLGSAPIDITNQFGRFQGEYEDNQFHAIALSVEF